MQLRDQLSAELKADGLDAPDAFNPYGALYQTLVGKLIDDPDFRAAVKR